MRRHLAILLASFLPVPAAQAANPTTAPFKGANCHVASPPAAAGEGIAQGLTVKMYPRKAQIDGKYTGCQTSWVEQRGKWTVMGVSAFEKGDAIGFWAPGPDGVVCKYKDGEPVNAKPGTCPAAHSLAVPSMAPGCVQKILGRAGTEGCKYE